MLSLQERFNHFLKVEGLRHSETRDTVARHFFKVDRHIGIEELYKVVRKANPKIGIATVYRTLNLLVKSGLAHKRNFDTGAVTYEKLSEEHHDHLICTQCADVVEFHHSKIEALQEKIAQEYGYTLAFHKMELYGRCPRCKS